MYLVGRPVSLQCSDRTKRSTREGDPVKTTAAITVAISALALVATSVADATGVKPRGDASTRTFAPTAFVGRLQGSDAFVAILLGEQRGARVYVYDSTRRIASWFDAAPRRAV